MNQFQLFGTSPPKERSLVLKSDCSLQVAPGEPGSQWAEVLVQTQPLGMGPPCPPCYPHVDGLRVLGASSIEVELGPGSQSSAFQENSSKLETYLAIGYRLCHRNRI